MAVIEDGGGATGLMGVGATVAVPGHVTAKPISYGALGHYRLARRLVPAGTTTAGILWEMQWTDATRFAVVYRVVLKATQIAAPTAAVEDIFNLKVARSFTVADTTGSASALPGASMNKLRTAMGSTLVAAIRETTAAGGATGGTKTLDTDPLVRGAMWVMAALSAASGAAVPVLEFLPNMAAGEQPLVLAQNEGWAISNENSFGTASGIVLYLDIGWAEVTAF